MITLEEFKEDEWYQERPDIIKQAIEIVPPIQMYRFKDSKKQCYIIAYDEPESGLLEDVKLTVQKTGRGGFLSEMGLGVLDTNQVFNVELDALEPWIEL